MSTDSVISVENLGKRYSIRHEAERYTALRDVITNKAKGLFRRNGGAPSSNSNLLSSKTSPTREDFWALKDVSFSVARGEVLGIIGRNGAGKTTLLKILSRITEPTEGRVRITGRVASLLEVGTGFHPELTGRENIYLNGAILGMSKAEIKKKFDEIVAFAETEKFLDTPVKRYSSGMYVRLAFAVAAHLEPEILVVDEVLAVGDAAFQKKCLGKMQDVSTKEGRTVLFVSHNMDSMLRLCDLGVLLDSGMIVQHGDIRSVVDRYQQRSTEASPAVDLTSISRRQFGVNRARFVSIATNTQEPWAYSFGAEVDFTFRVCVTSPIQRLDIALAIFAMNGFEIASTRCRVGKATLQPSVYDVAFVVKDLRLAPGTYYLNMGLRSERGDEDFIPEGPTFEVSTNPIAAGLLADSIRAACIPHGEVRTVGVCDPS